MEYANGSDEAFLVWLWHELYGDEPFDASILTRLKALPDPFAQRLPGQTRHDIRTAAWAGEWDKALGMLLAGLTETKAPVSPAEYEELTTLLLAIGQPAAAITAIGDSDAGSPAHPVGA